MNEIWKSIAEYEGLYEVSNLGRVKSLKFGKEKILKPGKYGCGYLQVSLYKNGQSEHQRVHRLVAKAFIQNPQNLPEVNHKDEDKSNNCVDNLEWVTSQENNNYGTRNLRAAEKLSKKVLQFTLDGIFVREWPSASEVERQLKIDQSDICRCCNGKLKSAYGFVWRYKPLSSS